MNNPRISIIVALSDNNVIGKDNRVPWHLTADLVRLKNLTVGHTVILGKKTYESLLAYYQKSGKPTMSMRTHIVVTRDPGYQVDADKGIVAHSIEEALKIAQMKEIGEIFVIGGEQIFRQTLPFVQRLYLTLVHITIDGDAFFPDYSSFTKIVAKEDFTTPEFSYTFLTLEK